MSSKVQVLQLCLMTPESRNSAPDEVFYTFIIGTGPLFFTIYGGLWDISFKQTLNVWLWKSKGVVHWALFNTYLQKSIGTKGHFMAGVSETACIVLSFP